MSREVRHEAAHHRKEEACSALGGRTRGKAQECDGPGGGRHPAARVIISPSFCTLYRRQMKNSKTQPQTKKWAEKRIMQKAYH